jgi:capsular exopolysaccharide synthesis family protein
MSRIHEALKKAEQERAMSQAGSRVETTPAAVEVAEAAVAAAPALGALPGFSANSESLITRTRQTQWSPDTNCMLFFNSDDHAPGMEEFRTLRSRLYQAREKQPLSKVLVTSALPKEGKSFTSANLAQVLARQHGRRVLLIDGDLRNPQLHRVLGTDRTPGLFEYLRAEADEFSIIQRGQMENLFFIPAGQDSPNPAELLANGRLGNLLKRLKSTFDWIIVDSAPAVPVSDAALMANECDGVLLVVRSSSTPTDAACRARQEFAERNVLGVVLNGITPELSPYMQYYYAAYGRNGNAEVKD